MYPQHLNDGDGGGGVTGSTGEEQLQPQSVPVSVAAESVRYVASSTSNPGPNLQPEAIYIPQLKVVSSFNVTNALFTGLLNLTGTPSYLVTLMLGLLGDVVTGCDCIGHLEQYPIDFGGYVDCLLNCSHASGSGGGNPNPSTPTPVLNLCPGLQKPTSANKLAILQQVDTRIHHLALYLIDNTWGI
jgi:hypothetical protein